MSHDRRHIPSYQSVVYMTQDDVDAGDALPLAGVQIRVVNASGVQTGVVFDSGAAGSTPTPVSGVGLPTSLTGPGSIALTQAAHAGRSLHAEPGVTGLSLAVADWSSGGEVSLINHTGEALPISLTGAGWLGGFVNTSGGTSLTVGDLVSLKPLERAIVQVKDGGFVNVAVIASGASEQGWAPGTAYRTGDIVRAPSVQGTIGAGDRIIRSAKGKSRAGFDATEAALWGEVPEDPDALARASNLSDLASVSTARTNLGLGDAATRSVGTAAGTVAAGNDGRLSDARAPTAHSHTQSEVTGLSGGLAAKQDALVSGTSLRTVNGAGLLGAGDVAVAADLPGGVATTVTDEGLVTTGSPTIDRTTVPGQTIIRWTGSGTFTPPLGVLLTRTLVVGGGGGGGGSHGGGGGGAGRVVRNGALVVVPGQSYAVTIGAGGAGADATGAGATAGSNSSFGAIAVANGGGRGGSAEGQPAASQGGSGGGGSGGNNATVKAGATATAGASTGGEAPDTTGTGNSGGTTAVAAATYTTGSGGGGAGGAGAAATGGNGSAGAAGGAGITSDITGASVGYGGGGGGGGWSVAGGTATQGGGAGGGAAGPGVAGSANTGGGGGGSNAAGTRTGGAGGSGCVIVRFPTQTRSYQALAGYASDTAAATGGILRGQFYLDSSSGAVRQRAS